jgi:DNA transformation protein
MDALDRIMADLAGLGDITSRSLFGGRGIYWKGTIFAIVFRDRVYLKVDDQSRGDYLARGMGPFRPSERHTLKSYHELPREVWDDPEQWLSWARDAIRAAQS